MTSQQSEGHTLNPYLFRGVVVNWMPQVRNMDMPYSGLQAGAVYVGAMIDWVGRYVLTWAVSVTVERAPSGAGLPDPSGSARRRRKQSADLARDIRSTLRLQIFLKLTDLIRFRRPEVALVQRE